MYAIELLRKKKTIIIWSHSKENGLIKLMKYRGRKGCRRMGENQPLS
jgi:hypothetical protein